MPISDQLLSDYVHNLMTKLSLIDELTVSKQQSIGPIAPEGQALSISIFAEKLRQKGTQHLWVITENIRHREHLESQLQTIGAKPLKLIPEGADAQGANSNLQTLRSVLSSENQIILLEPDSLHLACPSLEQLKAQQEPLEIGSEFDPEYHSELFIKLGYERVSKVVEPGQFAVRGGIFDIFSLTSLSPLRIELFDTEIDSLREFDIDTQITTRKRTRYKANWALLENNSSIQECISKTDFVLSFSDHELSQLIFNESPVGNDYSFEVQASPLPQFNPGDFVMQETSIQLVKDQIDSWLNDGWELIFSSALSGERERFFEILGDDLLNSKQCHLVDQNLLHSCLFPEEKTLFFSISETFGRYQIAQKANAKADFWEQSAARHAKTDELKEGELVVHAEYGVGRLLDLSPVDHDHEESLKIEYDNGTILEVPMEQSHLLAKYVGMGGKVPKLSKLGDGKWKKLKKAAESSVIDYAARLLRVQAERSSVEGTPHPPDTKWMWEFDSSFPYQETPDQLTAIADAKRDMESPFAMDRLICGDVGFGKTEIAIRAAFKAVCGGFQAVLLAPTTVLAEQHYRNFCSRMSEFPITIHLLNRFRKPKEVRNTLEGLENGSVDLVIGTHKVLSEKVSYKNLGLVVIDEEQRFGVKHKELFKERFHQIDMLTLSATPIPRTLYLSLMGARDMSVLNTAPVNRSPVQTNVLAYDEKVIKKAVEAEIERGGQVYFLHNRVNTIEEVAQRVRELVPYAKVSIGHGQMDRTELEDVMHTFVDGKSDVLIATTIIESGIDIPNANTIIIDRADRFGLADLYQLRGRVGRADRQAYAYLLLPKKELFSGDALKRVSAIKQYSALGSGFKIAMRDLEIRGAGNLLGTKQSGHIAAVGFDLYCQLLRESISKLKGDTSRLTKDVVFRADFICFTESRYSASSGLAAAFIPIRYITDGKERLALYRRLSLIEKKSDFKALTNELIDRFGSLPQAVKNLLSISEIKFHSSIRMISSIEIQNKRVMISRNGGFITLAGGKFPRLTKGKPNAQVQELKNLILDL